MSGGGGGGGETVVVVADWQSCAGTSRVACLACCGERLERASRSQFRDQRSP